MDIRWILKVMEKKTYCKIRSALRIESLREKRERKRIRKDLFLQREQYRITKSSRSLGKQRPSCATNVCWKMYGQNEKKSAKRDAR